MGSAAWSSSKSVFDSTTKLTVTLLVSGRFDGTLARPDDIAVVSAGVVRVVEGALQTCQVLQLLNPKKLADLNATLGVELAPELARIGAQGQVVIEKLGVDERSRAALIEANAALAAAKRKEMMEKMAQQEATAAAQPKIPKPAGVECSKCGARNTGKFCAGCGASLYTTVPVRLSFPNPDHCVVEDAATGRRHIDRVELEGVLHTPFADGDNGLLENNVADVIYVLLKEQVASGTWSATAIESGAVGAELCRAIAAKYEALGEERYIPMSTIEVTSARIRFSPALGGVLASGTHVLVQWSDGNRYPGVLQQTAQGQSLVAFANGTTQWVATQLVTKA
jgi:hypothetical protein